jgi:hypothetical protein
VIPRWGLQDRIESDGVGRGSAVGQAPPARRVHAAFFATAMVLGIAALVHLLRYLLLIINRNTLLNWLVADAAALLSVLASLAAIAAVITYAVLLTQWLIARRAAAFAHCGRSDTRTPWAVSGCLLLRRPRWRWRSPSPLPRRRSVTQPAGLMAACVVFSCRPCSPRCGRWSMSSSWRNRRQLRPAARADLGMVCCGCSAA